jgi:uncharacterized protein (TIGR02996 family)
MASHKAFLQAVCEEPDDDTHRLVYADWLEEQGEDGWAEFIRVQCEFARLPEYTAEWIHAHHRERSLYVRVHARLPVPALPEGLRWGVHAYRRGFLWQLRVFDLAAFLAHAPELFRQAPVGCLDIDARHKPNLGPLADSPWLGRLTRLEFSLGEFGAQEIGRLADSPHIGRLRGLAFRFAGISSEGWAALLNSPLTRGLHELDLQSNYFVGLGPSRGVAIDFSNLRTLSIRASSIYRHTPRAIFECPGLTHLNLAGNELGPDEVGLLAEAANLATLAVLDLSGTAPGVPGVRALVGYPHLTRLRALVLRSDGLGPVAARELAGCRHFEELRHLDLGNNPLRDNGVIALAGSPNLKGLVSLDLFRTGVTDAGARALLDSLHLRELAYVNLYENRFSEPVVKALKDRFGERACSERNVNPLPPRRK